MDGTGDGEGFACLHYGWHSSMQQSGLCSRHNKLIALIKNINSRFVGLIVILHVVVVCSTFVEFKGGGKRQGTSGTRARCETLIHTVYAFYCEHCPLSLQMHMQGCLSI